MPRANVIYIDLSFVQIQCKLVRNCVGRRFKMSQSMQKVIWISHKIEMDKSCKIHTFCSCHSSCVETAEVFFSVSLFIRITDHETTGNILFYKRKISDISHTDLLGKKFRILILTNQIVNAIENHHIKVRVGYHVGKTRKTENTSHTSN